MLFACLQLPLWVAPNLVTFSGLVVNAGTACMLFAQCPRLACTDGFASLACAVGLFVYQTLDAIDGKQARRTVRPSGTRFTASASVTHMPPGLAFSTRIFPDASRGLHPYAKRWTCGLDEAAPCALQKTSSPLGELFDHGCDAVSTIFVTGRVRMRRHSRFSRPSSGCVTAPFAVGMQLRRGHARRIG